MITLKFRQKIESCGDQNQVILQDIQLSFKPEQPSLSVLCIKLSNISKSKCLSASSCKQYSFISKLKYMIVGRNFI